MALFNDLSLPASPPQGAARQRDPGVGGALKYAPRRLRPPSGAEALADAQLDARYWRERAYRAETQLHALEIRVQLLAVRFQERQQAALRASKSAG